jgi:hypothetical protein
MLQPWPDALTQDVLGALACLKAIAAIGLVVMWGSESNALSDSSLMASTLECGRSVASRLKFAGTLLRALGSHWRKLGTRHLEHLRTCGRAWRSGGAAQGPR